MATRKPKKVLYRRKSEGRTNYKKRMRILLSNKLRVVVRFTNTKVLAQITKFTGAGDLVLVGVDSDALKKLGWNYSLKNFPAAYLTGLLLAKKAIASGIKEGVLDTGFSTPFKGGRAYAFLKGAVDGGLDIPFSEKILPSEERINGGKIADYAKKLAENKEIYNQRFGQYLKNNAQPEKIVEQFEVIKQKIMS